MSHLWREIDTKRSAARAILHQLYRNEENIWRIRFLGTRRSKQPEDKHDRRKKQVGHAAIAMSCLAAHIGNWNLVMFARVGRRMTW